tara:strand:- start:3221 stop:3430 length:210 start_codon:yes stop_codon:yes gene_type:complete
MNNLHYRVYLADEVASHMESPTCVTTSPRYTLDGTQAILKFTEPVDGWIDHAAALALVQTSAWQEEPTP